MFMILVMYMFILFFLALFYVVFEAIGIPIKDLLLTIKDNFKLWFIHKIINPNIFISDSSKVYLNGILINNNNYHYQYNPIGRDVLVFDQPVTPGDTITVSYTGEVSEESTVNSNLNNDHTHDIILPSRNGYMLPSDKEALDNMGLTKDKDGYFHPLPLPACKDAVFFLPDDSQDKLDINKYDYIETDEKK